MTILEDILAHKRREIAERRARMPVLPPPAHPPPDFVSALNTEPIGVIAEIKRRSPSAGPLRVPFDPAALTRAYEAGGAQAVSILMDAHYFGGGEADFMRVREATSLPLLYKEFILDEWQIRHATSLGASAVLLIAAALDDGALRDLRQRAESAGLAALVEVHDEIELKRAADTGARILGINNRDLRTFRVSLETTERLAPLAPPGALIVAESGIRGPEDAARLKAAGARALLVGEHLLRAPDVVAALRALRHIV